MSKLPKHTNVKLSTIYGEELEGVIIPLSIKATMDVEDFINNLKNKLSENRDIKRATIRRALNDENPNDTELFDQYVDSKITMDLSKLGEDVTDERVKSLKSKRTAKLLEGKTRDMILDELADIAIEFDVRKQVLSYTVSKTLWNVLRKKDNLREYLFKDSNDLENSLEQETLIDVFNQNVEEVKTDDEDLKN